MRLSRKYWALGLAGMICLSQATIALSQSEMSMPGYTEPSQRRELRFTMPAVIKTVHVKEGDSVAADQVLLEQDDSVEAVEWKALKLESESMLRVEAAIADLDQKKVQLELKTDLFNKGVASKSELQDAQLAVTIGELSVKNAEKDREIASAKAESKEKQLQLMKIKSPIAGVIRQVNLGIGELPTAQEPAIVIVQNNPLKVAVNLPLAVALKLKIGDELPVKHDEGSSWETAKIVFLDPEADAASGMRMVKLELPNDQNRPSGQPVSVRIPERLVQSIEKEKSAASVGQ